MRRISLVRIRVAVAGAGVAAVSVAAVVGSPLPAAAQRLSWSVVPSPSPGTVINQLDGVSCASATVCMAVGDDYTNGGYVSTLIESSGGTGWSVVPSPSPSTSGNFLYGVSCASAAACMAVGAQGTSGTPAYTALIEAWDGASWSVVPGPGWSGLQLHGVSCISATACTAVGARRSGTLIESWDGTSWSIVPSPDPSREIQHPR